MNHEEHNTLLSGADGSNSDKMLYRDSHGANMHNSPKFNLNAMQG